MKNTPTILIVEDDAPHRFMLDVILGSWGYFTLKARNGPDTLSLIQDRDVDLVLLDINLEHQSGVELLATLRTFDPCLPVILMTAYCPPEIAREAGDLGAGDILMKPIRLDELEKVVHRAFGRIVMPSTLSGGAFRSV
jgi:DNA-binding NtrC family response regulator